MSEEEVMSLYKTLTMEIEKIKDNEAIINSNSYFGINSEVLGYIRFLEEQKIPSTKEYVRKLEYQLTESERARVQAWVVLGQYKHYSLPDEEQNRENEAIVDKAYNILDIDKERGNYNE